MLSLANARSAEEMRGLGGADRAPPEALRHRRRADRLRHRAEDRRPGDLADLRGRASSSAARRAATGGSARTSPTTCGRSARSRCAIPRRARGDRGPRRGLLPALRLRAAQRGARRARPLHLRQPAQRRRRDDPPAGPAAGRRAPAADLVLRDRLPRASSTRPTATRSSGCASAASGSTTRSPATRPGRRSSSAASGGRSAARRSTTRSTGRSSRSTTGRSGAISAWSAASRAGRSPGSSRR